MSAEARAREAAIQVVLVRISVIGGGPFLRQPGQLRESRGLCVTRSPGFCLSRQRIPSASASVMSSKYAYVYIIDIDHKPLKLHVYVRPTLCGALHGSQHLL